MPRPRGADWLDGEIEALRLAGVDTVVSLLTDDEIAESDLDDESELCRAKGVEYISLPIPDRAVPSSRKSVQDLVRQLDQYLAGGRSVALHCRSGIGRSTLIAACLLVASGVEPQAAFKRISDARGCAVPDTDEQRQWVSQFAQELAAAPSNRATAQVLP